MKQSSSIAWMWIIGLEHLHGALFILGILQERYSMETAVAFGIFIAIVGYFIARSANKEKVQAVRAAQDAQEEISSIREATKSVIHSRAVEQGVDLTDEQLDWVCSEVESGHGKAGLVTVKERFELAKDEGLRRLLDMIVAGYQNHVEEVEIANLKDETERKWQAVLEDFKRMNPAQQKEHLAYIKKHTNELSDEQLHILKLISLSEPTTTKDTDIMIGDIKLFSTRKK